MATESLDQGHTLNPSASSAISAVSSYSAAGRCGHARIGCVNRITQDELDGARTDLDLFVYDAAGNLIVASEGLTDQESVWVLPFATGRFYIRVRNLGPVYNDCTLHIR